MRHLHRLAALAFVPALFFVAPAAVGAATPAAKFANPPAGVVAVVAEQTYAVRWSETLGTTINARRVAVQATRAMGATGCDPRWVPVATTVVAGTTYNLGHLDAGRCYRFLLLLETAAGSQTIVSSPIVAASGSYGPKATFTNPIRASLTVYDTANTIRWIESDTFGARVVSRSYAEQSATPAADGSCNGVTWKAGSTGTLSATSVVRTLTRGSCYRYLVTLTDELGFRSTTTSGAVLVATQLPDFNGKTDTYKVGSFVTQATLTWCVAASVQMMLNIILGISDTSTSTQQQLIDYARANDAAAYPVGSDPQGWAAALNRFGGGNYQVATSSTAAAALKQGVKRIRVTNKPAGILVWSGTHAWVLTGFRATADPATTDDYTVTSVFVAGPLYPRTANSTGYDPAPDTEYSVATFTSKFFKPYWDSSYPNWNGKYILILP